PQDVEATVERSHPQLRPGCSAAFAVEEQGQERLVVVAEVDSRKGAVDGDDIAARARAAGAGGHELALASLGLLPAGALAQTASGKIQRRACRADYLARSLESLHEHRATATAAAAPGGSRERADGLIDFLRDYAGQRLNSRLMDERRSIPPHVVLDL